MTSLKKYVLFFLLSYIILMDNEFNDYGGND